MTLNLVVYYKLNVAKEYFSKIPIEHFSQLKWNSRVIKCDGFGSLGSAICIKQNWREVSINVAAPSWTVIRKVICDHACRLTGRKNSYTRLLPDFHNSISRGKAITESLLRPNWRIPQKGKMFCNRILHQAALCHIQGKFTFPSL